MKTSDLKKIFLGILTSSLIVGVSHSEITETSGDNNVDVFERHEPISVTPVNEIVDSNTVSGGKAQGTFQFWVEAGETELNFYCLVTDMEKNNQTEDRDIKSVKLDRARGCRISAVNAVTYAGEDSTVVKFEETKSFLEGRDAARSDYVTFLAQDGDNFRQNFFVRLVWDRNQRALPVGEYRGAVKLIAEKPSALRPAK